MPVVIQPAAASDVKDELAVAHREVINHRLLREAVGTKVLQFLRSVVLLVQKHMELGLVALIVLSCDGLLLSPDDVEVVEHAVGEEEGGHVFVDIEGSGAFGAGTGNGRVGHNFEIIECVDTKIRHSDSEHRIMAFKDLNLVTLPVALRPWARWIHYFDSVMRRTLEP